MKTRIRRTVPFTPVRPPIDASDMSSEANRIVARVLAESPFSEKSGYVIETLRRVLAEELCRGQVA